MMKRFFAFLLIAVLLFMPSCVKDKNQPDEFQEEYSEENVAVRQGGTLTVSARKPETFNPLATNYESLRELLYLFYDGLFTLNEDFTVKGNLATDYSISEDALTLNVNIKEGVTFADGSSLGAADVIYSVDFIKMNGGSYAGAVRNIKSIEASGTHSVKIELFSPETGFVSMLTFPIIKAGTEYFTEYPNGTGQFTCDKNGADYTSLKALGNPSYHLGRPYIDEVNVLYTNTDLKAETSFLSGETDLIINSDLRKENLGSNIVTYEAASNRFEFLGFNSAGNLFSDEAARRAIFVLCDRASLQEKFDVIKAPVSTPINPAAYFYSAEIEENDFGTASEILERNGWAMGRNGVYEKEGRGFSFTILVNSEDSDRLGIANYLSHSFLSYGISADVEAVSYAEYKERLTSGNYDAFIGGCAIGNAANPGFLIGTGGSANVFGYSGGVMDMRIAALASARGDGVVSEAKKFGKAIAESAPVSGLYFDTTVVAAKKNLIIPKISPTGVYVTAYLWHIN